MGKRASAKVAVIVGKRYWREADARVVVDAWRKSGTTLSQFSADWGVPSERVSRWSTRLGVSAGLAGETRSGRDVNFHPVRIVGGPATDSGGAEMFEVCLGDGRRVRVPRGFVAADLARVMAVLEGRVSC
jgi:hypothetical protein